MKKISKLTVSVLLALAILLKPPNCKFIIIFRSHCEKVDFDETFRES